MSLPAPRILTLSSLHSVDEPGRSGHATVGFDGMPPRAPGFVAFGPLRLCGLERFAADYEGFAMHQHQDVEVVTLILEGGLTHRDTVGEGWISRAGDVQVMSAGRGMSHEELIVGDTCGVQIMLDPLERGTEPHVAKAHFALADRREAWVTVASGRPDAPAGALRLGQDAAIVVTEGTRRYSLAGGRRAYVLVTGGSATINGCPISSGERALVEGAEGVDVVGDASIVLIDLA